MKTVKIVYPFTGSFLDYPDNESYAVTVFFAGCNFDCSGCHNIELQDPDDLKQFTKKYDSIYDFHLDLQDFCNKNNTNKVVLEGGDPLSTYNLFFVSDFLETYGKYYEVAIYTGNDVKMVKKMDLKNFKFIKCGKYDSTKKQESTKTEDFCSLSSSNQDWYNSELKKISSDGILNFKK